MTAQTALKRPVLNDRARSGLDAVRGGAALYVVLHHLAKSRNLGGPFGVPLRFGQEAVILFFFLSGFVIFLNEAERVRHPTGYYLRRLRRIYPPVVVALIVTSAIAVSDGSFAARFRWTELIGTVLMQQDYTAKPGGYISAYLGNDPLWSLSYEVPFYLLFPGLMVIYRKSVRTARHVVGLCSLGAFAAYVAFPNHTLLVFSYWIIWWTGASLAIAYVQFGQVRLRHVRAEATWLGALAVASLTVDVTQPRHGFGVYPELISRHFVFSFLVLVAALSPLRRVIPSLAVRSARPIRVIAAISYGLYVLHYPLLVQWHFAQSSIGLVVSFTLLVITAYLTERQLPRLLPRAPRS